MIESYNQEDYDDDNQDVESYKLSTIIAAGSLICLAAVIIGIMLYNTFTKVF